MPTNLADQSTNPSLLLRIRNVHDRQAWAEFVGIYAPLVFRYCRRRRLQISDASDVVQEVLSCLSNSLPSFEYERERGRFRDWLGVITHREVIRFWKSRDRLKCYHPASEYSEMEATLDRTTWDSHFHQEVLQHAMERIAGCFESETWTIFQRVWIQGESAEQVAKSMDAKVGSVYVAKSRVLKRLQAEVLALSDDWPTIE
jgi:RNA polymerase sigma factor (sigma-70 family)